jgi:hypothetical protein
VTTEERVVALFAAANPIPDPDVFEPLAPFEPSFLDGFSTGIKVGASVASPDSLGWRAPRRLRPALTAALVVAALAAGVALSARFLSPPVARVLDQPRLDLGIFEPMRGWIMYGSGGKLEAIDPADPTNRYTLDFPDEYDNFVKPDSAMYLMPAGWSRDGSLLALADEDQPAYVMDRQGTVTTIGDRTGCCWFVTFNWLSPDGTAYAWVNFQNPIPALEIVSLGETGSRQILVSEQLFDSLSTAWYPDGSALALVTYVAENGMEVPTIEVISVDGSDRRVLVGPEFGHVRHLSWSPDGFQLLVVAGEERMPTAANLPPLNPLLPRQATDLYVVNADGSGLRAIEPASAAETFYVAGTWSPDGTQIAVIDYDGGLREIVVMNLDGTGRRVLTEVSIAAPFTGIAWHPAP